MGKRGPAPLPTNLKLLRGTHRADRATSNEPMPEAKVPSRPSWLGEGVDWGSEAVREWDRVVGALAANGLLTDLDRTSLAAYCDAFGRWWHFRREVAEKGAVQVTESGYVAQRPEVALMNKALDDVKRFGALFGMSPSDRTRISVPEREGEEANPYARFG